MLLILVCVCSFTLLKSWMHAVQHTGPLRRLALK